MAEPELVRADARSLCVRSLLTVGAFLAVAVACRLPNREFITRDQLGRAWPFTVASGTLYCERQGNHVVFESGGNHYAINGSAKGAATKNGYLAVDAIPQPLPGIGQRTKAALQAKRARGERAGTVPFGHQLGSDGQSLAPCAEERAVLVILVNCALPGTRCVRSLRN